MGVSRNNQLVYFRKWVIERLTYRYLSVDSGQSISTLKRSFKWYLTNPPEFLIRQRENVHLLIDGTYFSNDLCLVLYRDNDIGYTQLYRFTDAERYEQISEDLRNLAVLGVKVESITCDGHKATLKAIRKVYPDVTVQRCLVHVHRMAGILLKKKPKTVAGLELKPIVDLLPRVKTHNDRKAFIKEFEQWYMRHRSFVNQKSHNQKTERWWYKHRDLKRATTLIEKAIPNLFHYLNDPQIPRSTNGLESFFGHLKDTLSIHRGLSYHNRKAFILWYLHLKNENGKGFL